MEMWSKAAEMWREVNNRATVVHGSKVVTARDIYIGGRR